MGGLTFTHLALLGGLATLVIPILIHLLFRRPRRQMRFSTVQFFLEKHEEAARRQKIRHWLLLVTRCLLLTLVVVAFARPYLRQTSQAAIRPKRDVVLVLDRSASMLVKDRWAKARAEALNILQELSFDDRAALVEASAPPKVLSPLAPGSRARAALHELAPGFEAGDLAEGLTEAVRLLRQAGPNRLRQIVVISDFQRSGAGRAIGLKVPRGMELKLAAVGEMAVPNVALTGLSLESSGAIRLDAAGFGEGAPGMVNAEVLVDEQPLTNCPVNLARASGQVLTLPALRPGWHTIEARLAAEPEGRPDKLDDLAADNRRWLALRIPEPLRLLVAEPRPSARAFEEESFFIVSVLASAATNGVPFRCDKVPGDRLLSALAGTRDCGLVILPGLRQPAGLGAELRSFVTNGGGLLLFLGEAVAAQRYQGAFAELLPMSLRRAEGDPDRPEEFWHLGEFDKASPVFTAFRPENSGDPTRPAFKRRFALQAQAGSAVVARFTDGVPFIISRKLGRGRIVAVNTTADTAWTDWPKRKTFVPWLEGVIALAAGRPVQGRLTAGPDLACGIEAAIPIDPVQTVRLRGAEEGLRLDPRAGAITLRPEQPGVFAVEGLTGEEVCRFTASLPAAESDLAGMTTEEFLGSITRTSDPGLEGSAVALSGDDSRELWRLFLLAGLALLIAEFLLANRTWA